MGGNDWDKLEDYHDDVDITPAVAKINTETRIRSGKLKFRDTGNDHNYIHNFSNLGADRTITWPLLTADDEPLFKTFPATITGKTIDIKDNPIKLQTSYKYTIFQDGSDTKCLDNDLGTIVSTNTDDDVVIQYAIDNASGQPIFIKRGLYTCNTELNLVDKDIYIVGERVSRRSFDTTDDTVIRKTHSGSILNIDNTDNTGKRVYLSNLCLDGNDKTGFGILGNDIRFNMPFIDNVAISDCNIGMQLSRSWYSTLYNLQIDDCATYNLYLTNDGTPATHQNGCNTLYFYGGTCTNCDGTNFYPEVVNDVTFYSMIFEQDVSHDNTNTILGTTRTSSLNMYSCSFETLFVADRTIIEELGENNHYVGCRFESGNTNYSIINFGSTAKRCSLENCRIGGDATKTVTITIDDTAQDISLMNNSKRAWIQPTIVLNDHSLTTTRVGNTFCSDKTRRYSSLNIESDFVGSGSLSGAPFTASAVASGTVSGPNAGLVTGNHPGVIKLLSSTTTNSGVNLNMTVSGILLGGGECFEAIFNIVTLTDTTIRLGFTDCTTSSDAVDGAYIEIPSTGAAVGKTSSNSSRTTSSTIHTLSTGTWYHAFIKINQDATAVDFYIYNDSGSIVGTPRQNTANIPTGAGRECGPNFIATNVGVAAIDLAHVDYLHVWNDRVLSRG